MALIPGARAPGLDITTEVYPSTASMSPIEAADDDDWQSWPDQKFARFEWALTGERLTRASFERYRAIGGYLVDYSNTEAMVTAAVADSLTMIASDPLPPTGLRDVVVNGTVVVRGGRLTPGVWPGRAVRGPVQ